MNLSLTSPTTKLISERYCRYTFPVAYHNPLEIWINQILLSNEINTAELEQLKLLLSFQSALSEEQQAMIHRVFYGLRHGLLEMID